LGIGAVGAAQQHADAGRATGHDVVAAVAVDVAEQHRGKQRAPSRYAGRVVEAAALVQLHADAAFAGRHQVEPAIAVAIHRDHRARQVWRQHGARRDQRGVTTASDEAHLRAHVHRHVELAVAIEVRRAEQGHAVGNRHAVEDHETAVGARAQHVQRSAAGAGLGLGVDQLGAAVRVEVGRDRDGAQRPAERLACRAERAVALADEDGEVAIRRQDVGHGVRIDVHDREHTERTHRQVGQRREGARAVAEQDLQRTAERAANHQVDVAVAVHVRRHGRHVAGPDAAGHRRVEAAVTAPAQHQQLAGQVGADGKTRADDDVEPTVFIEVGGGDRRCGGRDDAARRPGAELAAAVAQQHAHRAHAAGFTGHDEIGIAITVEVARRVPRPRLGAGGQVDRSPEGEAALTEPNDHLAAGQPVGRDDVEQTVAVQVGDQRRAQLTAGGQHRGRGFERADARQRRALEHRTAVGIAQGDSQAVVAGGGVGVIARESETSRRAADRTGRRHAAVAPVNQRGELPGRLRQIAAGEGTHLSGVRPPFLDREGQQRQVQSGVGPRYAGLAERRGAGRRTGGVRARRSAGQYVDAQQAAGRVGREQRRAAIGGQQPQREDIGEVPARRARQRRAAEFEVELDSAAESQCIQ